MRPILKQFLHWTGSAFAIAGIIFVALRLHSYGTGTDFARFGMTDWFAVVGLALIYGMTNLTLALAWWNLLGQFGACTSRRWAIQTYGISQIAKYVPGNFFHLAGRQAIGMAAGLSGWSLAKSTVWELGLISATGGLFVLLALPLFLPELSVMLSAGIFLSVLGISAVLIHRIIGPFVALAFGWYAFFLWTSGIMFAVIIGLLVDSSISGEVWLPLIGAYIIAWLAGLVTPGAPAGIGVRELVVIFLLGGRINNDNLIIAVLLGRIVTVGGDVMLYLGAMISNSSAFDRTISNE